MTTKLILTGDLNLLGVTDPMVPFNQVRNEFRAADLVFSNLECMLYQPPDGEGVGEFFFVDPAVGAAALKDGGIKAVGLANNVNIGANAILSSASVLDRHGIPYTGAGATLDEARQPVIIEAGGVRFGILQRCSVFFPSGHAAGAKTPGIAPLKGHTSYEVPSAYDRPIYNRPGVPPIIVTSADPAHLQWLVDDIKALRSQVDFLVVSCHWGLHKEVLEYQKQIAHAALDAGADVIFGHGPHQMLAIEVYKGKPIYYGSGSFSFDVGPSGKKHGNWISMMAKLTLEEKKLKDARFQFVRHNAGNETYPCKLAQEQQDLEDLTQRSAAFGAKLRPEGDELVIELG